MSAIALIYLQDPWCSHGFTQEGDFCLNNELIFEVGGKNKNKKQIKGIKNSYVLTDNSLSADADIIPLWLLGFL